MISPEHILKLRRLGGDEDAEEAENLDSDSAIYQKISEASAEVPNDQSD